MLAILTALALAGASGPIVIEGVVAGASGAGLATAECDQRTVVLHLDDYAFLQPFELTAAKAEVTRIYVAAGVHATWVRGTVAPQDRVDALRHLVVVILNEAGTEVMTSGKGVDPTKMGQAVRAADRAYIFYPRVALAAHKQVRDVGTVLGLVIGHEVGHLLLPEDSHSFAGIMGADLDLRALHPLKFTPRQSATIRNNLSPGARCR
jgi:hypothetical protein